ncbi:MAG: Ig-like domain-containing protein, partial [Verrucomicrobiota bacterium]
MDVDVAEILGYSNALSPSESALVGGYLAAKYGIATTYPATGSLANQAATAITTTSATINATLKCNSNSYDVVAYWGPNNGGINPANWANSVSLGSGLNAASINLSQTLTNLVPGTTYYFNCCATNGTQTIWAAASQSFATTSTSKDFLTFGANVSGSNATIDTVARTVLWTVPFGTSLTSLAPAYTVSAQATGSPASGATLNFSAPQTYTLTGQDGSTKVYTVTVAADHTYPASSGATLAAAQDVTTALTAANFGYADPNSLALAAVQITALPLQGTLKLSGAAVASGDIVTAANIPNLTYQPVLYAYGTPYTTIGIKVMNSNNVWSIADSVMTVNVAFANHPPTSTAAAFTTKGGSYYTFWKTDFPFTDVDAGDWLISVKMTSLPAHGTLTLGGTPITTVPSAAIPATSTNTLIYTPNSSYLGADSFNYQVSDGKAFSANAAMAITVVDPNLIFVANGSFETPGGPNGPDWAFVGAPWTHTGGPWGQVHRTGTSMPALTGGGAWIANLNDSGVGVLTQDLLTSVGAGDTLTVTFFVGRDSGGSGVLQASFMIDGTAYSQNFDTSTQTANTWKSYTLTKTIIGPGNLSLRFSNVSGHVSWLDLVSNVTITPAAVVAANAPTSTNATLTAVEDTPTTLAAGNFGYSDPNSAPLAAVRIISLPTSGTLKLSGTAVAYGELPLTVAAANIGNLTYQSELNGNGAPYTTFWISVQNTTGLWSNAAMMTLNVTGVNDAPVANAQSVTTAHDTAKAITLVGTDAEGSALTYTVVAQPAHGTLSGTEPNVTYTPTASYNGADSFTFKVNDGSLDSTVATVTITVTAGNSAPVATAQSVTTAEDTAKAITLAGTDVDLDALTYAIVSTPAHGTLSGTAPNVTYTPTANYNGPDSFTFKVNDGSLDSAVATVTITVTAVNDAPVAIAQSVTTAQDTAKAITLAGTDVDLNALTYAIVSSPAHGTLSGTAPNVTYTPTTSYNGADSFTFKVNDGTVDSAVATVTLTVTAVNHAPTSTGGSVSVAKNTVKTFAASDFPFADVDAGDTLGAIKVTSLPANGTLSLGGTPITSVPSAAIAVANIGTLTYTPTADYIGAVSFNFQVRDASLFSADATMAISVTNTTFIPVLNPSFETTGAALGGSWFKFGSPWSITSSPSNYQVLQAVAGGAFSSTVAGGGTYIGLINNDDCPITAPLVQNLGTSVTAGDTLSVTFYIGRALGATAGGAGVAYFDVAGTKYPMAFDTSTMTAGTWQLQTMTKTITNSGNLTLGFYGTSAHTINAWLDNISNVSRTPYIANPVITATGSPLSALSTTYGTASATTSFTVSGANMTAGIAVTPPAGFEVSQTAGGGSGYAGSGTAITVGAAGTIASTTVY